jgi:hypothetical protein
VPCLRSSSGGESVSLYNVQQKGVNIMAGGYGPPYRAPCNPANPGHWPTQHVPSFGCYNHTRASAKNITRWVNATRVQDYRDPGSDPLYQPLGIPPYPRKSDAGCDPSNCGGRDACSDPSWPDTGTCPGVCGSPCHPDAVGEQWCDSWWTGVPIGGPPAGLKTCTGAIPPIPPGVPS